jgi:hypothetical protein
MIIYYHEYLFTCEFVVLLELNTQITEHSVIATCGSINLIRESKSAIDVEVT